MSGICGPLFGRLAREIVEDSRRGIRPREPIGGRMQFPGQAPSVFAPLVVVFAVTVWAPPVIADAQGDESASTAVKESLERILSQNDLRHLRTENARSDAPKRSWRTPDWLNRFLGWLFGGGGGAGSLSFTADEAFGTALKLLIILAVLVVAFFFVKALAERRAARDGEVSPGELSESAALDLSGPPGDLPPEEYLDRAERAAAKGDYRSGVREILLAGLSWIERRRLIRYRAGLTNRSYLRAVRSRGDAHDALSRVVANFEEVFFGRRAASAERFDDCMRAYRAGFRDEEELAATAD